VKGFGNLVRGSGEDAGRITALIEALDGKRKIAELLDECNKSEGISLTIGSESEIEELFDYSVVAHPFAGTGGLEGGLGIIGPKRMDYSHIISLVAYAAKALSHRLTHQRIEEFN